MAEQVAVGIHNYITYSKAFIIWHDRCSNLGEYSIQHPCKFHTCFFSLRYDTELDDHETQEIENNKKALIHSSL